jgi:hypothetical protein
MALVLADRPGPRRPRRPLRDHAGLRRRPAQPGLSAGDPGARRRRLSGRRAGRSLSPVMADRDRLSGAKAVALGRSSAARLHPAGLEQEIYALLRPPGAAHRDLRRHDRPPPCRPRLWQLTVALNDARDQVIRVAGVIAETRIDLIGAIDRQVLDHLLSDQRCRASPRVVKRAISVYAPNTARGRLRAPSYQATINIDVQDPDPCNQARHLSERSWGYASGLGESD